MKKGKKEQGERKGRKLGRGLLPRRFQPPGFGGSDARPHTPRPMPRNPPSFLNTFVRASRLDRQKPRESDDVRRLASARGLRPSRSCWGSASMLLSLVCRQSLVSGNGTRRRNMIFMFMFTSKRSFLVGIFLRLQGHFETRKRGRDSRAGEVAEGRGAPRAKSTRGSWPRLGTEQDESASYLRAGRTRGPWRRPWPRPGPVRVTRARPYCAIRRAPGAPGAARVERRRPGRTAGRGGTCAHSGWRGEAA